MKSKIDEVIGALELISFNMPKEYDSDEIPAWWVSLFAVKEQLEQLRPYVELGELVYNDGIDFNCDTVADFIVERNKLIDKIKKQSDETKI